MRRAVLALAFAACTYHVDVDHLARNIDFQITPIIDFDATLPPGLFPSTPSTDTPDAPDASDDVDTPDAELDADDHSD